MVEKFCSRSHGQPLTGVRSWAMISIRHEISREGVMDGPRPVAIRLYAARRAPVPAPCAVFSTGSVLFGPSWPRLGGVLEHDPEKWVPVFPRDKREAFARRSCSNNKLERDDDSKKSHRALARRTH